MLSSSVLNSVYGPVKSWRYGLSLGIDLIGAKSTCSFNCVYCQLGEIEHKTDTRSIFINTEKVLEDLQNYPYEDVDIITISGSGEPTLALNLGEVLSKLKSITKKPTLVLTNGSLLHLSKVRNDLQNADQVSVKIDAISPDQLRRINRPFSAINLENIWQGLTLFSKEYQGKLAIQTMLLNIWNDSLIDEYINKIKTLSQNSPLKNTITEIQLNIPKRPKPLQHQLDGRGNHTKGNNREYPVQILKCLSPEVLQEFGDRLTKETNIPVRLPKF
jgi:wyosine [tRNA(Phe)-imidazoG37] synthetase (radical SAM superfamily)